MYSSHYTLQALGEILHEITNNEDITIMFLRQMGQFSMELLDPQLNDNMHGFLNVLSARNFWRKNFSQERILRASIGSRKSQKISVSQKFPAIWQFCYSSYASTNSLSSLTFIEGAFLHPKNSCNGIGQQENCYYYESPQWWCPIQTVNKSSRG